MQIAGNTFLVTGAGSGLGGGTADHFAGLGANVVLVDVNEDAGGDRAARLGERSMFASADVTSEQDVTRVLDLAIDRFGAVHGVVNCAGILIGRRTLSSRGPHDLESFEKIVRVNLSGSFNVARLAAARMSENKPNAEGERGVIIHTASVAAYEGQIGQAAYSASKGGIVGMTLPMARDLAAVGIRVMAIAPGIFMTPMVAGMTPELQASLESQIPFPSRLGRADEYAHLAQHIVENQMLNGEVIRLDGAVRMGPR
jgi:NAD(P)-dependent dehydrogenase (short-subunit alcohol dehydrogenase family)